MSIYDFSVETITGETQLLSDYQGKVILIINTASKCGFTKQFTGLEKLYINYQDQGLVILGFPCNQFLHQDPKSNQDILAFCQLNYGVSFPMFAKVDVNGKNKAPLYDYLTRLTDNKKIEWNFTKFLINRQGELIARFSPKETPEDLEELIKETLLAN